MCVLYGGANRWIRVMMIVGEFACGLAFRCLWLVSQAFFMGMVVVVARILRRG